MCLPARHTCSTKFGIFVENCWMKFWPTSRLAPKTQAAATYYWPPRSALKEKTSMATFSIIHL